MAASHDYTTNGQYSPRLQNSIRPEISQIERLVRMLDAVERYSLALSRLSVIDGDPIFDEVQVYMKAAGSADRMTVECSGLVAGIRQHYVIGRSDAPQEGAPDTETILWNEHAVIVNYNEVLDARAATRLFVSYYVDGRLPAGFSRRAL